MAEWPIAAVLKTVVGQPTVGSNPTSSVSFFPSNKTMLHKVRKVKYLEDYKLELCFNDRTVKVVDLEKMLKRAKNMFLPLKDVNYFKQVRCDGVTINWPNGVDLCPDVLYNIGDVRSKSKSFKAHKRRRALKI